MNVREAISDYLEEEHGQNENIPSHFYSPDMEVQLMVDTAGAIPKGKAWEKNKETIWNIRIPKNARSEPEFRDYDLAWSLPTHAKEIGVTGWDFVNRRSRAVAFDFDEITADKHQNTGMDAAELERVKQAACAVSWVEVRKSTSGGGLHLRVFLDVPTANHTEHALLARYILTRLSDAAGYDFSPHVDICGGNFWIWSKRATPENEGFKLLKEADGLLADIPENWRGLAEIAKQKRGRAARSKVDALDDFAASAAELDNQHKAILDCLTEEGWVCVRQEHNGAIYRTHTAGLEAVHNALGLQGVFKTLATGQDRNDYNAFIIPQSDGAFRVVRYGEGTKEDETWTQDGKGWTYCAFNVPLDFDDTCRAAGGVETSGGEFQVSERQAASIVKSLGGTVEIPDRLKSRTLSFKSKGEAVWLRAATVQGDRAEDFPNWTRGRGYWELLLPIKLPMPKRRNLDHLARCVKHGRDNNGYAYRELTGAWVFGNQEHVKLALGAKNFGKDTIKAALEDATARGWTLGAVPFAPLYPGGRVWNLDGAQLACQPAESDGGEVGAWEKVLTHLGRSLTPAIEKDEFLKTNGIRTGADYLRAWIASLVRYPDKPLPYLFLFSEPYQNVGKSTLHQALRLLMTKGVARADGALTNPQKFNGELHGALVAVVEELNVASNSTAYDRIKDWVTSREISIHIKNLTPFMAPNTTHWIQCANKRAYCPMFEGDSRITMIEVDEFEKGEEIPWSELEEQLKEQAPAFLRIILNMTLPPVIGRFRLPVVETEAKREALAEIGPSLSAADILLLNALKRLADELLFGEECAGDELCAGGFLDRGSLAEIVKEAGGGELPSDPTRFGLKLTRLMRVCPSYKFIHRRKGKEKQTYYRILPPDHEEWLALACDFRLAWEEVCGEAA